MAQRPCLTYRVPSVLSRARGRTVKATSRSQPSNSSLPQSRSCLGAPHPQFPTQRGAVWWPHTAAGCKQPLHPALPPTGCRAECLPGAAQHEGLAHPPQKVLCCGITLRPQTSYSGSSSRLQAPSGRSRELGKAPDSHRGRFALVVAGVLLQDVQGLGLGAGLTADTGAGAGLVAVIAPGRLAPIGREGIAGGKVRACGGKAAHRA